MCGIYSGVVFVVGVVVFVVVVVVVVVVVFVVVVVIWEGGKKRGAAHGEGQGCKLLLTGTEFRGCFPGFSSGIGYL